MRRIILLILFFLILSSLTTCNTEKITIDKHEKQLKELINEKYISKNSELESFELFPIYDENEELRYFLVEFNPEYYIYIKIKEKYNKLLNVSMYSVYEGEAWQRYTIDSDGNIEYEKDEYGNFIYYNCSHFKVANITNEKIYLLRSRFNHVGHRALIPAVKVGDKFLNLISMEEFEYKETFDEPQAISSILFFYGGETDL